jgi:hypothetical protein
MSYFPSNSRTSMILDKAKNEKTVDSQEHGYEFCCCSTLNFINRMFEKDQQKDLE